MEEAKYKEKAEKKQKSEKNSLIASLFKEVQQVQLNEAGEADYKNTLCAYFKAGVCEKGKKCKYSHDLSVADAKKANIDVYTDPRAKSGNAPDTIITCKDFIEAVEKNLYGFNWECPNKGDKCQYRHMLPAGYVIRRDKGAAQESSEDEEDKLTMEQQIEEERALLSRDNCIPVTLDSFNAWKERKAADKKKALEA